ncbi:MAG: A/G-specific adenine glycosylase [Candidatus Dojkabacteria bacterium]
MMIDTLEIQEFSRKVWDFYSRHSRVLPWRETDNPYHILVSEVMLQQTQIQRVLPKYAEWLQNFPDIQTLAEASLSDVLSAWSGLGYNRRAKALKETAGVIASRYGGEVPVRVEDLLKLPGIGPYTAGAVYTFSTNKPSVIIETNIRAVYLYHFFSKRRETVHDKEILPIIEHTLDGENPRHWYYALMDYGAWIKKTYGSLNARSKHCTQQTPFKGSRREIRGKVLKELLQSGSLKTTEFMKKYKLDESITVSVVRELEKEKYIVEDGGELRITGEEDMV